MRFLSSKLAVIISFYVYAIEATNRPGNFVCERKYYPSDIVSKSLENSCNALKCADVSCRFTAAFDGSHLFGIRDAALFSVPTKVCYGHQYLGGNLLQLKTSVNRVNSRIVIDSMCNLIGLVYRRKKSFHRCEETFDSKHGSTITSDNGSNISPKNFGYRCNGKIFLYQDIFNSHEYLAEKLFRSAGTNNNVNIIEVNSPQFDDKEIYLWSIYGEGDIRKIARKNAGPYRIAVNKANRMVGLAYRNKNKWYRCIEMQSVDPKPPKSIDGTKNSIGETIFKNISPYKCGGKTFSVITLNSHMQAACRVIQEDANKVVTGEFSFPIPNLATAYGGEDTRFWPVRQLETGDDIKGKTPQNLMVEGPGRIGKGIKRRNIFIKLNFSCDFLDVYIRLGDEFSECQKVKISLPTHE